LCCRLHTESWYVGYFIIFIYLNPYFRVFIWFDRN
jgi:hypothetical protein